MVRRIPNTLRLTIFAAVVCLVVPVSAASRRPAYDSFYVFGDSIVDVGNIFLSSLALGLNPPTPPSVSPHRTYYQGRFSNGPVAVEYLWEQLTGQAPGSAGGLQPSLLFPVLPPSGAIDFAFGATGVGVLDPIPGGFLAPGLLGQIQLFSAALTTPPSEHALYAIVTGANEYGGAEPSDPLDVVDAMAMGIRGLYSLGARHILVSTLPDLSTRPFVAPSDAKPQAALTRQHNLLLKKTLHDLGAELDGIDLMEFDLNDAVKKGLPKDIDETTPALDAFFPPSLFPAGFRMSFCVFSPATCLDVPTFNVGLQYKFWDAFHTTTEVHRVVGEAMYEAVTR